MAISQTKIKKIVSIDGTHEVLSTSNKYIIKCLCVFKLVRALLVEQCQSRRILWCLSLRHRDPILFSFGALNCSFH